MVCVNVAAATMDRCDVLVALGPPEDPVLETMLHKLRERRPIVISMYDSVEKWRTEGFAVTRWPQTLTPHWLWNAMRGRHYSIWVALSYAFTMRQGPVHLWGCDLEGRNYSWHPASRTGRVQRRSDRDQAKRWRGEFSNLRRIGAAARAAGMDFHVHGRVGDRLPWA